MHAIAIRYEDGDDIAVGPYPSHEAAYAALPAIVRETLESDDDDTATFDALDDDGAELRHIVDTGDASAWGVEFRIVAFSPSWSTDAHIALGEALNDTIRENTPGLDLDPDDDPDGTCRDYADKLRTVYTAIWNVTTLR